MRVHEGLATGKADLFDRPVARADLVEKAPHLVGGDIGEAVVCGGAFDVAVRALDIAKRSGVEPERAGTGQRNRGARLAIGGDLRVFKFGEVAGRDGRLIVHVGIGSPLSCACVFLMKNVFRSSDGKGTGSNIFVSCSVRWCEKALRPET